MSYKSISAIIVSLALCACAQIPETAGDGTAASTFEGTVDYETYFTSERLRLDFVLAGNKEEENIYLSELHRECEWAGSPNGLISKMGYGSYAIEAFSGDNLIFSAGFNSLFDEWVTTEQAKHVSMAQNQTVWMPFPRVPVHIVLYKRARQSGRFVSFFECDVDPADRHIIPGPDNDFKVTALMENGPYASKVDLAFSGEGYTEEELPKLRADAARLMEYLFSMEPYAHRRSDFNVYLVESVSEDSGVDIPNHGQWKNTVMDSNFDTFYEDRYLTIQNHQKIASVYSGTPFDVIFVIANDEKYGGGGIYNFYCTVYNHGDYPDYVIVHEMGHLIGGLADEYYTSETSVMDYYPEGIEPVEPNLTTLVDFDSKWKSMLETNVPVPTPATSEYKERLGVYQGGGYVAEGVYRPWQNCTMKDIIYDHFCPVCTRTT